MKQIELSFIVPAYNEEAFIETTLESLDDIVKDKNLPYEIVVVDDGSNDKTYTRAITYANRNGHVKVITYPSNVGKGHAVKTGFLQARGDVVVFTDSDMEINLNAIVKYVEALKNCDIVIASKWHPESEVTMPFFRKMFSRGFNMLVQLLTGIKFKDTQAGLKAIKRSAFLNIFPKLSVKRYAFDVELLTLANIYGLKVVELPLCVNLQRPFSSKELIRMFIDLLGITYRLRITHWYHTSVYSK